MIRRFLGREGRILLEELGAPDARTLLRRVRFWVRFYIKCGILLGGIVAVEQVFGLAAMWIAMAGVLLLLNRTRGGRGADPEMYTWMGVTPPGGPQLPPSGTPQIGRASTALTPSRLGPVARR